MRVAVVGAGISGLAAAFRLQDGAARRGVPLELTVLEANPRPGGHAWTTREDGFLVEGGPNGFLDRAREPQAMNLVRDLGIESRLIEARPAANRRYVLLRGKLHRAPEAPPTLISSGILSPAGKLRLLLEPWARPAGAGEETVYEFARRRIGAEAAEVLVDAAVAGISAGDSRRLSVAAAFPLMIEMERDHGSLIRAMMARRGERKPRLVSFEGGMETLIGTLRERLAPALRTGARVERIAREAGEWRLRLADGGMLAADHVLLATPAARSAEMMAHHDAALAGALGAIPYSGLALVALAFREADLKAPLDGYGYLVARAEQLDTLGVVWESSLFEGRAPGGTVLLRAMLGGARRPEVADLGEGELITRARREIAQVMGITSAPLRTWVRRWPAAIAQYELGHLERVGAARALAARHPGLELCGSAYDGVAFGRSIASADAAAERMLDQEEARQREGNGVARNVSPTGEHMAVGS